MNAIALTNEQKLYMKVPQLSRWCKGKLKECGIKQTDLARFMGTTSQNIHKHFYNETLTIPMLIAVCYLCEVPAEELEERMCKL